MAKKKKKNKKRISSEKAARIARAAAELALAIEARHRTKKNGCYPAPTPVVFEALTPKGFISTIIDAARWEFGYQSELKWFQHDGDGHREGDMAHNRVDLKAYVDERGGGFLREDDEAMQPFIHRSGPILVVIRVKTALRYHPHTKRGVEALADAFADIECDLRRDMAARGDATAQIIYVIRDAPATRTEPTTMPQSIPPTHREVAMASKDSDAMAVEAARLDARFEEDRRQAVNDYLERHAKMMVELTALVDHAGSQEAFNDDTYERFTKEGEEALNSCLEVIDDTLLARTAIKALHGY